ncbi:hypothetical protein SAMN05660464_1472 [Geodermatophilus dictyosporus]|uniref:Peptidase propeptide and YPEB domain-containing protein n=2 Tax=Geodermatophilus dictyosporus TaxID=1523247 RepID=A0A1I5KZ25_9ACTN|nr:hypothetical protein SAMN05660464_1472 [Geodermatophilus dictyosporus]
MNRLARLGAVLVAGGTMALTASPAGAHPAAAAPGDDAGWVPIEELRPGYYDPIDISACGTTVTMTTGDVADIEGRETPLPDGGLLFEVRGDVTVDLTRHDTGQVIDELDVSGPYTEQVSADGTQIVGAYHAPSILFPYPELGPVDAAAFEAAGIPDLAYVEKGVVTFDLVIDPDTGEAVTEEADVDGRIIDLCTWFDGDRGQAHGHAYAYADHR